VGGAEGRLTTLEDKYVRCLWFESVNSGTSGTVSPPTESTILLDQWAAGVDALASKVSGGVPTLQSPQTAEGVTVTASLDVAGNYSLSGVPSAYPVAVIYAYKVKLKDLDNTKVLGGIEVMLESAGSGVPDGGTTGQVLGKLSEADGDADWITASSGAGLLEHDSNGDLMPITGTGTDDHFELDVNGDIQPLAS